MHYLIQIRIPEIFHVVVHERIEFGREFHVYAQRIHVLTGHTHVIRAFVRKVVILFARR